MSKLEKGGGMYQPFCRQLVWILCHAHFHFIYITVYWKYTHFLKLLSTKQFLNITKNMLCILYLVLFFLGCNKVFAEASWPCFTIKSPPNVYPKVDSQLNSWFACGPFLLKDPFENLTSTMSRVQANCYL